jgi:hypothetical protein
VGFTELNRFLNKWEHDQTSCTQLAKEYLPLAKYVPFGDEKLVRRIADLLTANISCWARSNSPIYYVYDVDIIDKAALQDKNLWYVSNLLPESQPMATSGSTTGMPFAYLRWEPALWEIEVTNHYQMIIDDF